ncbi:MAG: M28 family peptidase [Acidobacteria bacterium]|nr:M28 family peptidase [Acidobacteriota bacterium]
MRRVVILIFATTLIATAQQRAPEIESIRQADMKADLTFLASDVMAGRLTDTPQNALAAEWIASRFERLGLKPVGDDGTYYQKYNLVVATLGAENTMTVGGVVEHDRPKAGVDFSPQRFSASATGKGEVVFVGYGISSPERGYDDYGERGGPTDSPVKGKIVIAIDHEPGESDPDSIFDGVVTSHSSSPLNKALAAQARGAVAILFVSDVHNHQQTGDGTRVAGNPWPTQAPRIRPFQLESWVGQVRIPAAQVSRALAEALLAGTGRTLMDLAKTSDTPAGSTPIASTGAEVQITTSIERTIIPDRNVVGMIEGADPRLKDEIVIVCAHYDHDGVSGANVLNGADDDGSGTVGVMEIAEAYAVAAQKGERPKRSVLFAAWNSEERGLFGAWAYTEKPIVPLARTVAVLNMDMIGRNEEVPAEGGGRFRGLDPQTAESNSNAVNIIGTTRSASLKNVVERANAGIGLTLRLRYDNNVSQLMRRSDHWPFLNNGVPAVWVHTGLHPDYHTANDDAGRINYPKMEKIARMVYQASWDLAHTASRPTMSRPK